MVVYEVNLRIDPSIEQEFHEWLDAHIPEMLEFEGFLSAEWFGVDPDESDPEQVGRISWTVQYRLDHRASLHKYLEEHAARMREDGLNRFGDKFAAYRRIMTRHQSYTTS
jgi:quinol monooxygenase YgiN